VNRRRVVLTILAFLIVAAVPAVLVWFQPQKLVIDRKVSETAPPAVTAAAQQDATVASGTFRELTHPTKGEAKIIRTAGQTILRFENFETSDGPDVVVYLSSGDVNGPNRDLAKDFVDLGALKGNVGDQNYVVPEGTDLERYDTAVVWCRRFTVAFAAAELV
jgi:hypothetical protein